MAAKRRLVVKMAHSEAGPRKYGNQGYRKETRQERELAFWANVKIKESGCWDWTAAKRDGRYGTFMLDGKNERTHRASWILTFGKIPQGKWILHKCDRPICVNPGHLFVGTHKDNVDDMVHKGRSARGERAARTKLNGKIVDFIRRKYERFSRTFGTVALGRKFGVSSQSISAVVTKVNWKYRP